MTRKSHEKRLLSLMSLAQACPLIPTLVSAAAGCASEGGDGVVGDV